MTCVAARAVIVGPRYPHFPRRRSATQPLRPAFWVFEQGVSFVLGSLLKGLGLSTCTFLCIVSLRVWGVLS